jgi:hypothetical protein
MTVNGSIDTPDRTVMFEGQSYNVTAVKQADPGDSVSVTIDAPSGNFVEVYIYNAERQIIDSKEIEADRSRPATVTFDLSGYSSGSYMFTLQYDGDTKVAHPLVVRAYDVSTTAPSEANSGGQVELTATLTELRSATRSGVEFVIMNDQQTVRTDAEQTDGSYAATVNLDSLDPGEYSVYATVRGTKEVDGNTVRLGLSQPQSLTVTEQSSKTGSDGTDVRDRPGGGGSVAPGNTDTPADTDEPTNTDTVHTQSDTPTDQTSSTQPPADESPSTPSQSVPATETDTTSTATEATENRVITPQSRADTQQPTTTTGTGPGFSAGVTGLIIVGVTVALLCRRRCDE